MSLENLLYTLVGMAVGLAIGLAFQVRWVTNDHGDNAVRIRLNSHWQRLFFLVVGACMLFTVVMSSVKNAADEQQTRQMADLVREQQQQVARQTFCNRELIRVIDANAKVNAADRANNDGLLVTLAQQVLNPNQNQAEARRVFTDAFRRYLDERAANAAARQPYPAPDCGE